MQKATAKIGVLTFSPVVLNPGTVFQSWSLCHFIDSIPGLEAELIFYEFEQRKIFKNGKLSLATLWVLYSMWRSCDFAKKIKKYPLNKALVRNTISSINGRYDMILVGGDQVWNPILTKFDKSFFLDFAKGTRKAAYAPSIGNDDWPEKLKPEIQALLKDYELIGIREKSSIPAVEKLTQKPVHWSFVIYISYGHHLSL